MDDVVIGSNYPEIVGNAVFLDAAIYARHGLRVELMNPPAEGVTLNEAMTIGRAHFTHLLSHPILAAVQGLGLKYLASYQDEGFEVIARPGIRSLKDLEGKKVSFATPMMNKNFFYAFRQAGGDPGTLIPAGYGGVIHQTVMGIAMADLDYLRDGRIDAMALLPPMSSAAMMEGFHSIFRHGDVFPTPVFGLMTRDSLLAERRELVLRMLRALDESVRAFLADRAYGIALVERLGTPKAVASVAYDMARGTMHPLRRVPDYVQREWIENEKQLEHIDAAVPVGQVFDFSLLDILEASA